MSTPTVEEIATILAEHQMSITGVMCLAESKGRAGGCGWRANPREADNRVEQHRTHLAEVIRAMFAEPERDHVAEAAALRKQVEG